MDRLNGRFSDMHGAGILGLGHYLSRKDHNLHSSHIPINMFYWEWRQIIKDHAISMDNFKYVEYSEPINLRLWAFKKD